VAETGRLTEARLRGEVEAFTEGLTRTSAPDETAVVPDRLDPAGLVSKKEICPARNGPRVPAQRRRRLFRSRRISGRLVYAT
jgi:hypothetical protein